MGIGRFYVMVGALLRRPADGKYLVLKRSAEKDFAAGTWECTTGRVDQGESLTDAVRREVREELDVEVQIDFIIGTAHFYRGEASPENEIVGILYCCSIEPPGDIRTSWEHSEYRWVTAEQALELFPENHWLRGIVQRAEAIRALLPAELQGYYREDGFEL